MDTYRKEEFARHVELDNTYVSMCERGVCNPILDVIVKLAGSLGVAPSELPATIPLESKGTDGSSGPPQFMSESDGTIDIMDDTDNTIRHLLCDHDDLTPY